MSHRRHRQWEVETGLHSLPDGERARNRFDTQESSGRRRSRCVSSAQNRTLETGHTADGGDASTAQVPSSVLLAPALLSVGYLGVYAAVGPAAFDTGRPHPAGALALVALGVLLHLAGYATARLYTAATARVERGGDWRPNPWLYVGGGALTLVCLRIVELLVTGTTPSTPGVYLLGNAVVALPLASVVAGPVYWLHRRRRTSDSHRSQASR
ncbi:hypothetical protein [Natronobiforma cellulositropha]|uniref:hypothetical protein n=1 Tax=Natronobiforma cellulositropha TaxID=1679076 RepID=UPI0021D58742|nr:hypothetical protein [Natronobiforma cellulositropha]